MMAFEDDLHDVVDLAKSVVSDRKKEKEQADEARKTVNLTCPYCKTASKFVWKGGALPACPNCGAAFDVTEEMLRKAASQESSGAPAAAPVKKVPIRLFIILGVVLIVMMIVAGVIASSHGGNFHFKGDATFNFRISSGAGQDETDADAADEADDADDADAGAE